MRFVDFKDKIESIFNGKFDKSLCVCKIFRLFGKHIYIDCYLAASPAEDACGYLDNDMFKVQFAIDLPDAWNDGEDMPDDLTLTATSKRIRIKPDNKYLFCGVRHLPYRKTTGGPEKLLNAFERFTARLYDAVAEEYKADNLIADDMALVKAKAYIV